MGSPPASVWTRNGHQHRFTGVGRSCQTLEIKDLKQEEPDLALYLKAMREKLEALMGEIKDDREQRKQWAARRE